MLDKLFKEAIELGHTCSDSGIVFFIKKDKVIKLVVDFYGENTNSCYETALDINLFRIILGEHEGILVNIYDGTIEPVRDTWDGWVNDAPYVPLK